MKGGFLILLILFTAWCEEIHGLGYDTLEDCQNQINNKEYANFWMRDSQFSSCYLQSSLKKLGIQTINSTLFLAYGECTGTIQNCIDCFTSAYTFSYIPINQCTYFLGFYYNITTHEKYPFNFVSNNYIGLKFFQTTSFATTCGFYTNPNTYSSIRYKFVYNKDYYTQKSFPYCSENRTIACISPYLLKVFIFDNKDCLGRPIETRTRITENAQSATTCVDLDTYEYPNTLSTDSRSFTYICPYRDNYFYLICYGISEGMYSTVCSGHGKCIDWDTCSCNEGYTGNKCQYPICNGKISTDSSVCGGQGSCLLKNICLCNTGYVPTASGSCVLKSEGDSILSKSIMVRKYKFEIKGFSGIHNSLLYSSNIFKQVVCQTDDFSLYYANLVENSIVALFFSDSSCSASKFQSIEVYPLDTFSNGNVYSLINSISTKSELEKATNSYGEYMIGTTEDISSQIGIDSNIRISSQFSSCSNYEYYSWGVSKYLSVCPMKSLSELQQMTYHSYSGCSDTPEIEVYTFNITEMPNGYSYCSSDSPSTYTTCNKIPAHAKRATCSGHGKCVSTDVCECETGYSSPFCSNFTCKPDCGSYGTCIGPDTCACIGGYHTSIDLNYVGKGECVKDFDGFISSADFYIKRSYYDSSCSIRTRNFQVFKLDTCLTIFRHFIKYNSITGATETYKITFFSNDCQGYVKNVEIDSINDGSCNPDDFIPGYFSKGIVKLTEGVDKIVDLTNYGEVVSYRSPDSRCTDDVSITGTLGYKNVFEGKRINYNLCFASHYLESKAYYSFYYSPNTFGEFTRYTYSSLYGCREGIKNINSSLDLLEVRKIDTSFYSLDTPARSIYCFYDKVFDSTGTAKTPSLSKSWTYYYYSAPRECYGISSSNPLVCSGHGACMDSGECFCQQKDPEYSGDQCQINFDQLLAGAIAGFVVGCVALICVILLIILAIIGCCICCCCSCCKKKPQKENLEMKESTQQPLSDDISSQQQPISEKITVQPNPEQK